MSIRATLYIDQKINQTGDWCCFAATPVDDESELKRTSYGNVSLVGEIGFMTKGKTYDLVLEEKNHPKYGPQYVVETLPALEDLDGLTEEEDYNLLCEITTEQQANNIHKVYPHFVKMVLQGQQDQLDYHNIYNVGEVYFNLYCTEILTKFAFFRIKASFKEYNLSDKECKTLCNIYGTSAEANTAMNKNPYAVLTMVLERRFENTDALLIQLHPEFIESDERCESAIYSVLLRNEEDGNTRIHALEMLENLPASCIDLVPRTKDVAIASSWIHYDEETKDMGMASTYHGEVLISNMIISLLKNPHKLNIEWEKYKETEDFILTDEQGELLRLAVEQNICMLLGYAGSGKTSAVQALINMLEDNDLTYTLLAPTGMASKQLANATHRSASTIHRKIGSYDIHEIDTDFVIIDEISMCAVEHMTMVAKAVSTSQTKVIIVGDNAQLASIACGNILEDMLQSDKIPSAKLTKIFRYGIGSLTTVATDIRSGKKFVNVDNDLCFDGAGDDEQFEFIPINHDPLQQVMESYEKLRETYDAKDILILSPFNTKSFGTRAINNKIQEQYNPLGEEDLNIYCEHEGFGIEFRKQDRVINTKNNYDMKTYDREKVDKAIKEGEIISDSESLQLQGSIYNGDIGIIREVREDKSLVVQIDETLFVFSYLECFSLLLGDAISIHRIQGSAAKAIILLTHPDHDFMLSNNLMYVGATRSKEKLVWIGDSHTINQALQRHETLNRKTWLLDLVLKEEIIKIEEDKGEEENEWFT